MNLDSLPGIITAIAGGATMLLGAFTMYVKARSVESIQMNTLRRLWDWLELKGLVDQLPQSLRNDVRRLLARPAPDDEQQPEEEAVAE